MFSSQLSLKGKSSPYVIDVGHGDPGQDLAKDLTANKWLGWEEHLLSPTSAKQEKNHHLHQNQQINIKYEAYPECTLYTIYSTSKFIVHLDFFKISFS